MINGYGRYIFGYIHNNTGNNKNFMIYGIDRTVKLTYTKNFTNHKVLIISSNYTIRPDKNRKAHV